MRAFGEGATMYTRIVRSSLSRLYNPRYAVASCYAGGATSARDREFLLSLVYRFSKPERSNSRDEESVEITLLPANMSSTI